MIELESERLRLRPLTVEDAGFVHMLYNDPSFLHHIGDRGVRSVADAESYIVNGPLAMYARLGFGLLLIERRSDGVALGICGLLKREGLDDPDLGFALLPTHWGQGYAVEAAARVLRFGRETLGLARVVAITTERNLSSARVLEKIGMRFERMIDIPGDDETLRLFAG